MLKPPLRLLLALSLLVGCAATSPRVVSQVAQVDSPRIPVRGAPSLGRPDALVTVVVFSDLKAPASAHADATLSRLRLAYGDDLRVVWRNDPGDDDVAFTLAEAAVEAHAQGGDSAFWTFHDMLIERAWDGGAEREELDQIAAEAGLDARRMRAALDEHVHEAAVRADMELARRIGVRSGPALVINGSEIDGEASTREVRALVDRVRAHAQALAPRERVYALMVDAPVRPQVEAQQVARGPAGCARGDNAAAADGDAAEGSDAERIPVGRSPSLGCPDALVTMVVFSDFQCPFCSRVTDTLRALRSRYGADLRIVWKNNPLPFHNNAPLAAEAAMEVYAQRGAAGFWRFHDVLFANQQHLERADLERYARRAGVDMRRFSDALDEHTHAAEIEADKSLAMEIGAAGTPNFFINGTQLVGAQPVERFTTLIDAVLTRARTITPRSGVYAQMVADPVPGDEPTPSRAQPDDENRVYTVRANPRAPTFGPANARVVIEHFSDFQCPFCARVGPTIDQIRTRYRDRVRLVWRDYPLPFHNNAMLAAEAAREVFAQRGNAAFWRFNDALFANQQHLERADLERYARTVGVDLARFRRALDAHTHQPGIRDDMAAADATGAQIGTPAFFINGRFVAGALPFEEFQRRIDAALAAPAAP